MDRRKTFRPMLEVLEQREVLSATYSVDPTPSHLVPPGQQVHAADISITVPDAETATQIQVQLGSAQATESVDQVIIYNLLNNTIAGTGSVDLATNTGTISLDQQLNPGTTKLQILENTNDSQNPGEVNVGVAVTSLTVGGSLATASGSITGNAQYLTDSFSTEQLLPITETASNQISDGGLAVISRGMIAADPAGSVKFAQIILSNVTVSGGTMDGFQLTVNGTDDTAGTTFHFIAFNHQLVVTLDSPDTISAGQSIEIKVLAHLHGNFDSLGNPANMVVTTSWAAPDDTFSSADLGANQLSSQQGTYVLTDAQGNPTVADFIFGNNSGEWFNSFLANPPTDTQTVSISVQPPPSPPPSSPPTIIYGTPPDLGITPPALGPSLQRGAIDFFWAAVHDAEMFLMDSAIGNVQGELTDLGKFFQDWGMFLQIWFNPNRTSSD